MNIYSLAVAKLWIMNFHEYNINNKARPKWEYTGLFGAMALTMDKTVNNAPLCLILLEMMSCKVLFKFELYEHFNSHYMKKNE